jgi:hypothetical protein
MNAIESIFEIKAAVLDLQRYSSKDTIVSKKVQIKYAELIDRFFRENVNLVKPQQRDCCLNDPGYFLSLMEETVEHYYLEVEE